MIVGNAVTGARRRTGRLLRLLLALVLMAALAACGNSAQSEVDPDNYVISWTDPGLENAVRQKLEKSTGSVTWNDLGILKIVNLWPDKVQFNGGDVYTLENGLTVESLEDLKHFRSLAGIQLSAMPYENLDGLVGLDKLQRVILQENENLTDISALMKLPKLVTLVMSRNDSLTDYSVLGELPKLAELDLHNCRLTNVEFLRGQGKIKKLILHNNRIADLTPLELCTSIQELDIHANLVEDISVVAKFPNLFKIYMQGNGISDLSPLMGLEKMRHVVFDFNNVKDLTPLYGLPDLRKVSLTGNPATPMEVAALSAKTPEGCEIVWQAT